MRAGDRARLLFTVLLTLGAGAGLLLGPGVATPARAVCIDYGDYAHRAGLAGLPGAVHDVAAFGGLAIAADEAGLHILDLRVPSQPLLVGTLALPRARSVAVAGDFAFAIDCASSLYVVDLADPAAPQLVASLVLPGPGRDIEVAASLACVAADTAGLFVVDISQPTAPALLAVIGTPYSANDVALQDGFAFVADLHSLFVVSLTDSIGATVQPGGRPGPYIVSVAVAGDYAYALDTTFGIHVFDVSQPLEPDYVNTAAFAGEGGLAVADGRLFAGARPGFMLFDLSEPAAPALLCSVNTTGEPADLAACGDLVYVAIPARAQIDILDITNPAVPQALDTLMLPGFAQDVDLAAEDIAYVSTFFDGLAIVDVSDPEALVGLGYVPQLPAARQTVLVGDRAYVAAAQHGLRIVDITEPDAATVIGGVLTPGTAVAVAVAGNWAYVADHDGLRVIDVSKPVQPWIVGQLDTPGVAEAVAVALPGQRVLVADSEQLLVVDVSAPAAPSIVESIDLPTHAVHVEAGLAYAAGRLGLTIYAIGAGGELDLLGSLPLPGYPMGIALADGVGYLASNGGGLQVVDLAEPSQPLTLGSVDTFPAGVAVGGQALFLAGSYGLTSYPLHCDPTGAPLPPVTAASILLLRSSPNPFNPATTLTYSLPEPGAVSLAIYDLQGRLLRRLVDEWCEAGEHSARWDGRDASGRPLASGVYFARLDVAGEVRGRRLVLLK